MKNRILLLLSLVTLLAFAACSNTVADVSTSGGGEIEVTESDVGKTEQTVDPEDGPAVTETEEYESYTLTYTDPDGYTVSEDAGGSVTFSLDGYEVGKIVYVPAQVEAQVLDQYYAALASDVEAWKAYVADYAANLDVDYEVEKLTVNGQEALLATGTVAEGSMEGNPGDVGYVLIMPVGDQLVVIDGFADAETAETIKADITTFAGTITATPVDVSAAVSAAASAAASTSSAT